MESRDLVSVSRRVSSSGGFRVGEARGKTEKGPSDDVIILNQPR